MLAMLRSLPASLARRLLALALALASAGVLGAQREAPGLPPSRDPRLARRLARSVPLHSLPPVDLAALRTADGARPKGAPLRYGVVLPLELASSAGEGWEDLPDGGRLWRQRIASPGARSLGLVFRRFQLPPGGELYVSDASGAVLRGAYTDQNQRPAGGFAVQPIPGDTLTLEYRQPSGAAHPELVLAGVVHDYVGVLEELAKSGAGAGAAASCELDVVCPAGAGWEDQADSVARILAGGFLCSGVLLNNSAGDGAQLLLSAEHCGDLADAVFYFRYQRALCGAGSAPATHTVQGALELVRDSALDLQLVRITEPIPDSYQAFLAGWERSGAIPSSTLTIHHPRGQAKKISFDRDAPRRSGTRWRILAWDEGVTEPGSSGAPLFSPQGLVIGQLCCGSATCGYPFDDYYGRLDAAWALVAPHLDPAATGASTLAGRPLSARGPALSIALVEPASVPALQPGTQHTLTLRGTSFAPDAALFVDGVALPASAFRVLDDETITLDLPQLPALGAHTLSVASQGELDSVSVQVVAPSGPLLQAASGDPSPTSAVRSTAGLELLLGGPVGQTQYVLFSTSALPSVLPAVGLCLGDGFRLLELATVQVVGAPGWSSVRLPLPPLDLTLHLQSVTFEAGLPIPVSNCQSVSILP